LVTLPPIAVNGVKVKVTNTAASNGVIHIIADVFIPCWVTNSITDRVAAHSDLSTLLTLVVLVDLDGVLAGAAETTLLAPIYEAFTKLSAEVFEFLSSEEGIPKLTRTLLYHVFPGIFVCNTLADGRVVETRQGGVITVSAGTE
jgi:uncharacterized surface protein with fasciclin (FAS1) repeats